MCVRFGRDRRRRLVLKGGFLVWVEAVGEECLQTHVKKRTQMCGFMWETRDLREVFFSQFGVFSNDETSRTVAASF